MLIQTKLFKVFYKHYTMFSFYIMAHKNYSFIKLIKLGNYLSVELFEFNDRPTFYLTVFIIE